MNPEPTDPIAPAPALAAIEGASFSLAHKLIASALLVGLAAATVKMLMGGGWGVLDDSTRLIVCLLTLLILSGYWGILTSRTSLDGQRIRQSWLWPKEVRLAELTQVKLIHVHSLSWLIAPRLVVRAGGISVITFHVADPLVLAACRRLAYG